MIVDPWGTVVAQAADRVGIVGAELDLARVRSIRRQIPALANRRPEVTERVEVRTGTEVGDVPVRG
jgi:predicted amidohydrolase